MDDVEDVCAIGCRDVFLHYSDGTKRTLFLSGTAAVFATRRRKAGDRRVFELRQ